MGASPSDLIDDSPEHSNEVHSSTQDLPGQEQQPVLYLPTTKTKRKKRCHGDQKLRRFKKKCRKRGMTEDTIKNLIDVHTHTKNENQTIQEPDTNNDMPENMEITTGLNDSMDENTTTTTTKSNKRKQMTPSSSQRSTSQTSANGTKRNKSSQISVTSVKLNYRLPMYLRIHPQLLFQTVRRQLKCTLKKKIDRRFIHCRLQLIDQQCRLDILGDVWRSYSSLGSQHQVWPVSFHSLIIYKTNHFSSFFKLIKRQVKKMAKSDEHTVCEQFVTKHLREFKFKYDQYTNELRTQGQSCPRTLLPLTTLDRTLKDFVQIQQQQLKKKLEYQSSRYKDIIQEKELLNTVSTYNLNVDQVNFIHRIHLSHSFLYLFIFA